MAMLNISSLIQSRRALIAIAAVVPIVGAAIAVPALMGSDPEPETAPPPAVTAAATAPIAAAADAQDEEALVDTNDAQPGEETGPHAGGDLDLSIGLRFTRYPTGAAIRATVDVVNNSLSPVFLPAPSEPQPTLVVLVLDDAGGTVRRVVEETGDTTPRRMRRLDSGESSVLRIDVVTRDEEALAPGTYHLVASYESDDGWLRSGLDVWRSPQGMRRSDRLTFEVIGSK